ncbi:hypothetical protein DL93DRAFT_2079259 [Clavulina sp. PMI_390]|nr:hypothetical protein DL93DRAFT_2079259 [Clavulina sp. PMI_390]
MRFTFKTTAVTAFLLYSSASVLAMPGPFVSAAELERRGNCCLSWDSCLCGDVRGE